MNMPTNFRAHFAVAVSRRKCDLSDQSVRDMFQGMDMLDPGQGHLLVIGQRSHVGSLDGQGFSVPGKPKLRNFRAQLRGDPPGDSM